jgi:hypothetical protein
MPSYQPSYNVYFDRDDIDLALACMDEYGYCVIRNVIDTDLVQDLKRAIDEALDPKSDLPPAANRYHMMFAEAGPSLWQLTEQSSYMNYVHKVHGTTDLTLHRSAAILRTPGEGMGLWHTDHRGHIGKPRIANEVLNRYAIPSGSWFYLNGSHPDRSGIAVIEKSNGPDWPGPEGFELKPDRTGFHRIGEAKDTSHSGMDVPGCIGIIAEPGDLICFAALTYHANMASNERRYSCAFGFRPKTIRIDAPWPLPDAARDMVNWLPNHLKPYTDGYTGYDGNWRLED